MNGQNYLTDPMLQFPYYNQVQPNSEWAQQRPLPQNPQQQGISPSQAKGYFDLYGKIAGMGGSPAQAVGPAGGAEWAAPMAGMESGVGGGVGAGVGGMGATTATAVPAAGAGAASSFGLGAGGAGAGTGAAGAGAGMAAAPLAAFALPLLAMYGSKEGWFGERFKNDNQKKTSWQHPFAWLSGG